MSDPTCEYYYLPMALPVNHLVILIVVIVL
jgi:hypothetical protein